MARQEEAPTAGCLAREGSKALAASVKGTIQGWIG